MAKISELTVLASELEHAAHSQMQLSMQHRAEALRYYAAGQNVKGDMAWEKSQSEQMSADAFIRKCKKVRRDIGLERGVVTRALRGYAGP